MFVCPCAYIHYPLKPCQYILYIKVLKKVIDLKQLIVFWILLIIFCNTVSAVVINQVLFDPVKSENGGEAIELYNKDDAIIDISGWYISTERSEKDILFPENTIIKPNNYFLITDKNWSDLKDNQLWRNSDFQEAITLNNKDSGIILKDKQGVIIDYLNWTKVKEGNSLLRINNTGNKLLDFIETIPQLFSLNSVSVVINVSKQITNNLNFELLLDNVKINTTEIMPKIKSQELMLKLFTDEKPEISFLNKSVNAIKSENYYFAKISLDNNILPGNYSIFIKTKDNQKEIKINYGTLAAFEVDTKRLRFDINPGKELIARFKVKNIGNVDLDIDLAATDLISENGLISIENFQIIEPNSRPLKKGVKEKININRGRTIDFVVKIFVPADIQPGDYNGLLSFDVVE